MFPYYIIMWKWKRQLLSPVRLFLTPRTVACQISLSMEFSRNAWMSSHSLLQGSSQPRDWTWVSCIAGRFFYCVSQEGSPLYYNVNAFINFLNLFHFYKILPDKQIKNNINIDFMYFTIEAQYCWFGLLLFLSIPISIYIPIEDPFHFILY